MNKSDCQFEKVSRIGSGIALLFIASGLSVIGGTAWPTLGLFVAAAALIAAAVFFLAPKSQECTIS
jgi:hypothetical protein